MKVFPILFANIVLVVTSIQGKQNKISQGLNGLEDETQDWFSKYTTIACGLGINGFGCESLCLWNCQNYYINLQDMIFEIPDKDEESQGEKFEKSSANAENEMKNLQDADVAFKKKNNEELLTSYSAKLSKIAQTTKKYIKGGGKRIKRSGELNRNKRGDRTILGTRAGGFRGGFGGGLATGFHNGMEKKFRGRSFRRGDGYLDYIEGSEELQKPKIKKTKS